MKHIKYSIIGVIIAIVLLASGGCLIPPMPISPPQPVPAPAPSPVPSPEPGAPPSTSPINPSWTPPQINGASAALPDFVSVIAKVKPSVVAITTKVPSFNIFTGSTFAEAAGSGWIISQDGYIVTNNHVVEGADSIEVTMDDGRSFNVELGTVRTDAISDLAILKIDAIGLPAATIGDSTKLRVGDWVVAIGNSLGLGISATKGIVSALNASLPVTPDQTLTELVQVDAAINPGNSGGPLVNMAGEVVGINSAKVAEVGVEGMGYSISTAGAIPIIQTLINNGYIVRPWLGVGLYTVDEFVAARYNLGVTEGAIITEIGGGSPAAQAGLKVGDVITSYQGKKITSSNDVVKEIRSGKIGQSVEITYWRGKNQATTTAILRERPR